LVEDAPPPIPTVSVWIRASTVRVCVDVQVLAWARLIDAITAPVVGEIVSVPSLFVTEVTPPPAVPLAAAVIKPLALTVILALVNEPTLAFTVARVNALEPEVVASPLISDAVNGLPPRTIPTSVLPAPVPPLETGTIENEAVGAAPAPPPNTKSPAGSIAEDAHVVAVEKYGIPPEVPATVSAGVVVGVATEIKPPVNETLVTVPEPKPLMAEANTTAPVPVVPLLKSEAAGCVAVNNPVTALYELSHSWATAGKL
jgi:hypothetical protein